MERISDQQAYSTSDCEILNWKIEPIDEDYRDLPIQEGFNWDKLLGEITESRGYYDSNYYLVVFRSVRSADEAIAARIEELDSAALQEAKMSDALLHYFAGSVNEDRRALSWCLWTNAASARQALSGPAHIQAVREAGTLYDQGNYMVDCYNVQFDEEVGINFTRLNK